jgi:XTP/dITP diphosphohydrolase
MVRSLRAGEKLVVATHNAGKAHEFAALFTPYGVETVSAGSLGLAAPEETGTTFEENALIKARAAAEATGLPALSDDSGLVVDALDGAPGVYSADWAGPGGDFAVAMQAVEDGLRKVGAATPAKRTARFVAVLCMAFPGGGHETFRGEVEGTLVWPPRGTNGFGYDPMFVPEGYDETFGEMPSDAKQGWSHGGGALSHRARAFAAFAAARLPQ